MRFKGRAAGKTKRDQVRNASTRGHFGVKPVIEVAEARFLQWLGHVLRMAAARNPRQVFETRPEGKRGTYHKENGWST